jgi:hypothetical protein
MTNRKKERTSKLESESLVTLDQCSEDTISGLSKVRLSFKYDFPKIASHCILIS